MRARTSYLSLERDGIHRRIHASEISQLLGVAERTVRRWVRGDQAPPRHTLELLEILALGVLPWPDWRGFSVDPSDERLHSGNGYAWTRSELEHWGLVMARVRFERRARP